MMANEPPRPDSAHAPGGVLFVTPSPEQLRAGAVWVTIENWRRACEARWGSTKVFTPRGELAPDDVARAAWGSAATGPPAERGHLRNLLSPVIGTAAKDMRMWWRMTRFDRTARTRSDLGAAPAFIWQHHDLFQRAGFTLAERHQCPLVLFVDAPVVWEATQWGVRRPGSAALVEKFGEIPQLRHADLIACVSDDVAEACVERGANASRVIITPCTADSVRTAVPQMVVRQTYGLDERVVVGWLGSFRNFHAADGVVRAVAQLARSNSLALLMVGDGPTRRTCERLAVELGISHAVFAGSVPHSDIPDHLAAIDVGVIPSRSSADFHYSPLKLKEFLASGIAVVAPAVGEMARVLHHDEDVLLYPPGDEAEMTACIASLINDAPRRKRLGAAGRATYDRLFTMEPQINLVSSHLGIA
jgi:glycosyltransferase involved in cell wall biosynthesis